MPRKNNPALTLPKTRKSNTFSEIQRISEGDDCNIFMLESVRTKMIEKKVARRQILEVLRSGSCVGEPVWAAGWECRFSRTTSGETLTVIAKLEDRGSETWLIVTKFWR